MGEVEAQLRGGLAMTQVTWLTSPELAVACRTGFAPADRAAIVEALAAQAKEPGVNAEVPWAMAGPSGADPAVRTTATTPGTRSAPPSNCPPRGR